MYLTIMMFSSESIYFKINLFFLFFFYRIQDLIKFKGSSKHKIQKYYKDDQRPRADHQQQVIDKIVKNY